MWAWGALIAVFAWSYGVAFVWTAFVPGVLDGLPNWLRWTFEPTIPDLVRIWSSKVDDYGHCFLVIPFAVFLLWHRRSLAIPLPTKGTWWALVFFAIAAAMRFAAAYANYEADRYSLFPLLIGITLLLGGWMAFRWAWPSIVFLLFMLPTPGAFISTVSFWLQTVATRVSLFAIQTLGFPAMITGEDGHRIQLVSRELEVARACSGLRSLMLVVAVCVGAAFVLRRPLWERLLLVACAAPFAVFGNVMRIVIMAVLSELISPEAGNYYHEGVLSAITEAMIAIFLVWALLELLSRLLVEPVGKPLTLEGRRASPMGSLAGIGPRRAPGSGAPESR